MITADFVAISIMLVEVAVLMFDQIADAARHAPLGGGRPEPGRFGISMYPQPVDWPHFIDIVQRAEAAGIDSCLSYDHPEARADCWTALSVLALATKTIKLGTLVDCIYLIAARICSRARPPISTVSPTVA